MKLLSIFRMSTGRCGIWPTEVGDANAQGSDLLKVFICACLVYQGRLGQFNDELLGRQAGGGEGGRDVGNDVCSADVARGCVHGHPEKRAVAVQTLPGPGDKLMCGGGQYPAPDVADQGGCFGDGDEVVRKDPSVVGAVPSDQRFEAFDVAAAQVDHRLVVQFELRLLQAFSDRVLHLDAGCDGLLVRLDSILPGGLRGVQRLVCPGQELT